MNAAGQLNFQILVTLVCWGTWGIFDKKALENASEIDVMIMLYTISTVTIPLALLILNATEPGWQIANQVMFWTALASFAYSIAQITYLAALERSEASFVLGITASYPIVAQVTAWLFLGEQLVAQRVIGALVVAAGIAMIGASAGKERSAAANQNPQKKGRCERQDFMVVLLLSAIATFCWGIFGFFDKKALGHGSPLEVFLMQRTWDVVVLILLVGFWAARKHRFGFGVPQVWFYCFLSEAFLGIGGYSYLLALAVSSASYVITITGCYPLLMYLAALLFLKEKFNRIRLAGIVAIVAGGIAVQLTQGL